MGWLPSGRPRPGHGLLGKFRPLWSVDGTSHMRGARSGSRTNPVPRHGMGGQPARAVLHSRVVGPHPRPPQQPPMVLRCRWVRPRSLRLVEGTRNRGSHSDTGRGGLPRMANVGKGPHRTSKPEYVGLPRRVPPSRGCLAGVGTTPACGSRPRGAPPVRGHDRSVREAPLRGGRFGAHRRVFPPGTPSRSRRVAHGGRTIAVVCSRRASLAGVGTVVYLVRFGDLAVGTRVEG